MIKTYPPQADTWKTTREKHFISDLKLQWWNWRLKGDFSDPGLELGKTWGCILVNVLAYPWLPISSPFTHVAYLLPCSSYLACSKSVSALLSDPHTMTITARKAKCLIERQKLFHVSFYIEQQMWENQPYKSMKRLLQDSNKLTQSSQTLSKKKTRICQTINKIKQEKKWQKA